MSVPVHLLVQNINGKFRVSVYLGSSIKASSAFAISMDYPTAYFNPVGAYSKRTVEIPQPGTVSRTPTYVDLNLGVQTVVKTGYGAALVGDFAMISSATMTREDLVHGYQIEPEVLTGEVGADVKVGMHMNMTNENSNTYTTATESSAGYSTSYTAGDMVIAQSLLTALSLCFQRHQWVPLCPLCGNNSRSLPRGRNGAVRYEFPGNIQRKSAKIMKWMAQRP